MYSFGPIAKSAFFGKEILRVYFTCQEMKGRPSFGPFFCGEEQGNNKAEMTLLINKLCEVRNPS